MWIHFFILGLVVLLFSIIVIIRGLYITYLSREKPDDFWEKHDIKIKEKEFWDKIKETEFWKELEEN